MPTTEATLVGSLARRVGRFGLAEAPEPRPFSIPDGVWPTFLEKVGHERLSGLAVAASGAGVLVLPERQKEELLERHRENMVWALGLERILLDLADRLDERDIEFVVLKGPSLAHTVYPDPSWRPFGDLDLMVRTLDWRRALTLLADLGYRRLLPEPRKGFDERFGKAATHENAAGQQVDLHRTLVLGPFGLWMDPEELLEYRGQFSLGGRSIACLDATGRFVNTCVHATLGLQRPLLHMLRDVVQTMGDRVEWDRVAEWSRRWHLAPVIRHALVTMSSTFAVACPAEAMDATRSATKVERRALEAYTTARRSRGGTAIATLRAIRGFRGKAGYVRALALPEKRFMRERAGNGGIALLGRWRMAVGWLTGRKG